MGYIGSSTTDNDWYYQSFFAVIVFPFILRVISCPSNTSTLSFVSDRRCTDAEKRADAAGDAGAEI